jgi:hypothetical protein
MEPIRVEESFDIVLNKSEIPLEEENEDERSKKSMMLPSSQSENDERLHLILNELHEQRINQKLPSINYLC